MKKGYIFSPQLSLYGEREIIGFGDENFMVKEVSRDIANILNTICNGRI